MKILCFYLVLTLSFSSFATEGEGRFESQDGDSLSFIKKHLLNNAFKEVITHEMKNSGLNADEFWIKYQLKFEEYFEPIREELKKKFGITEENENQKTNRMMRIKEQYEKTLRVKKLNLLRRYGNLNKAIKSYSIKSMTRSPQYPKLRYITVNANVNRKYLNSLYFRFTSEQSQGALTHLFISYDLSVQGIPWSEVGVATPNDLTSVIKEHWKRKLAELMGTTIENIVIADEGLTERLNLFYKSDRQIQIDEEEDQQLASFNNGIWIKVKNTIRKIDEKDFLKVRRFKFDGDIIVLGIKNKKNILYNDFNTEEHQYSYADNHKLSSNIASLLYRMPMNHLNELPKEISSLNMSRKIAKLKINNIESINELMKLRDYLGYKGAILRISSEVDRYKGSEGVLSLEYQGENHSLSEFLLGLDQQLLDEKKLIQVIAKDNPFDISLIANPNYNEEAGSNDKP